MMNTTNQKVSKDEFHAMLWIALPEWPNRECAHVANPASNEYASKRHAEAMQAFEVTR